MSNHLKQQINSGKFSNLKKWEEWNHKNTIIIGQCAVWNKFRQMGQEAPGELHLCYAYEVKSKYTYIHKIAFMALCYSTILHHKLHESDDRYIIRCWCSWWTIVEHLSYYAVISDAAPMLRVGEQLNFIICFKIRKFLSFSPMSYCFLFAIVIVQRVLRRFWAKCNFSLMVSMYMFVDNFCVYKRLQHHQFLLWYLEVLLL